MMSDSGDSGIKTIGVGVIGLGGMGGRHARILAQRVKGANVHAVFDPDTIKTDAFAGAFGAAVLDDDHAVVTHEDVDAVVIASPDATHARLVLACLEAGKPVLCEKPLAQSAEEAWKIVEREAAMGRRLTQVGFMRRYDPAHLTVRRAIDEQIVGLPQLMRGWHRNEVSRPGTISERVVTGSLIHDLDSTRWLMDEEIVQVHVVGQRVGEQMDPGQHDLLLVECALASGRHALLEVFVNARYGYEVGVEIVGSLGIVATPPEDNALVKRARFAGIDVSPDWLERFDTAYEQQMVAWIQGLQSGQIITGADAWDGYASLVCADACIESLRSGQDVSVKLPACPALYAGARNVMA